MSTNENVLNELLAAHALPLKSIKNARQLGGYITEDGKKVKMGRLLRSSALVELNDEDANILTNEYRLTNVVDFRMTTERAANPDRELDGVTNQHILLFEFLNASTAPADFSLKSLKDNVHLFYDFLKANDPKMMYCDIIRAESTAIGYRKFFDVLLNNKEGATLWHCTAGKDRAGLASLFTLIALGVDKETALQDFEVSNAAYAPTRAYLAKSLREAQLPEDACQMIPGLLSGVDRSAMERALDLMDEKFGGVMAYIRNQIGLTEEEISTLRDMYLEEA